MTPSKPAKLKPEDAAPARRAHVRRTANGAKKAILDAADRLISKTGPGGLRLQDVAAELGMSHPVILHHFGSREGLMRALNERILDDLRLRLLTILNTTDTPTPDIVDRLLDDVFTVFRGGLAQRLVWLAADAAPGDDSPSAIFSGFVDALHEHRVAALPNNSASRTDTQLMTYLVAVAALGDAVFGGHLLACADGAQAAAVQAGFRTWLSRLLQGHLGAATPDDGASTK